MASAPTRAAVGDEELYAGQEIRAIYEQFDLDPGHVAMISDPENEYAWIQSNVTTEIEA